MKDTISLTIEQHFSNYPMCDINQMHEPRPVGRNSCRRQSDLQANIDDLLEVHQQDTMWGAAIIGIGLVLGGSIFLGQLTLFNFFFDGLGIFFIGIGAMSMMGQQSSQ